MFANEHVHKLRFLTTEEAAALQPPAPGPGVFLRRRRSRPPTFDTGNERVGRVHQFLDSCLEGSVRGGAQPPFTPVS